MRIKKWQIQLLFILIMLGFIFIFSKKDVDASEVNYLKENAKTTIHINSNDLNNQAFIVSELHGFKKNEDIRYSMLTYLNQVKNVHYYLAEVSFSSGYLLNEYIQTGDETLLDRVFSYYKGSNFYTKEKYAFYQKLYLYNLNHECKIKIVGIDLELSDKSAIDFFNFYTHKQITTVQEIINQDYSDELLKLLKKNLLLAQTFYDNLNWQKRDDTMYQSYLVLSHYYHIRSFYAQLGSKHGLGDMTSDGYRSFAYDLNHDELSNVKNKVLSIMIFYKNSDALVPFETNHKISYQSQFINRNFDTNSFNAFNQDFIFFNLTQKNSPYKEKLIWYGIPNNNRDNVTTDYYQYMMLINHSSTCHPLDDTRITDGGFGDWIENIFFS